MAAMKAKGLLQKRYNFQRIKSQRKYESKPTSDVRKQ